MDIKPPEPPDNVVRFRRLDLSEEFRTSNYIDKRGKCPHDGVKIVDEKNRTVECEKCKTILDPIMCLIEITNEWQIYHGPRLRAIREFMAMKRQAQEDFGAWWQRIGRGRSYPTKKRAAEEAWIVASAPELTLCAKLVADDDSGAAT